MALEYGIATNEMDRSELVDPATYLHMSPMEWLKPLETPLK